MTHWTRLVALSVLPAAIVLGAVPAFAAEPPKKAAVTRAVHAKAPARPVAKNTQPIPPGKSATGPAGANRGSKVMLNPQPIPPGKSASGPVMANGGSKVMLNTQPIPPGKSAGAPTTTHGADRAIIFVGGKGTKQKAAPKAAPAAKQHAG